MKAAPTPAAREALLDAFAAKVHLPYMVMAALLVVLAIWIARSSLPEIKPSAPTASSRWGTRDGGIFTFPHLWLGVLCLFLYVGVEVMAGDAIGTYGASFHLPLSQTSFFTAFTLGAMLLGYVAGLVLIPRVYHASSATWRYRRCSACCSAWVPTPPPAMSRSASWRRWALPTR